jgi:transcriptional regulator with XRE-family HTH domain
MLWGRWGLATAVRRCRQLRGWPCRELAARVGLSVAMIVQLETERRYGSLALWRRIGAALDIPRPVIDALWIRRAVGVREAQEAAQVLLEGRDG